MPKSRRDEGWERGCRDGDGCNLHEASQLERLPVMCTSKGWKRRNDRRQKVCRAWLTARRSERKVKACWFEGFMSGGRSSTFKKQTKSEIVLCNTCFENLDMAVHFRGSKRLLQAYPRLRLQQSVSKAKYSGWAIFRSRFLGLHFKSQILLLHIFKIINIVRNCK